MEDKTIYLAEKLEIAGRKSEIVPRILGKLLDETEAGLVLAAAPPATVEELSAKTGIDAAKIEAMIDSLFRKGILFKSRKPDGIRYYRVRQVLQVHDSTAVMATGAEAQPAHRDLRDLGEDQPGRRALGRVAEPRSEQLHWVSIRRCTAEDRKVPGHVALLELNGNKYSTRQLVPQTA
jgi:hypothetical protein